MRFVDSSFWVALRFRRDERHPAATALWGASRGPLLTTNHVVGETWTFLRRRIGYRHAVEFIDAVERSPSLRTEHVGRETEEEAWRWLRRHGERPYSFVDATSFVLAKALRVREVLAFDGDFSAAGFVELRPHRAR